MIWIVAATVVVMPTDGIREECEPRASRRSSSHDQEHSLSGRSLTSSLQAFDRAIAIARRQGARLHLLEVLESVAPPGGSVRPTPASVLNQARAALESDMRQMLVSRRASDVKVEIVMRKGTSFARSWRTPAPVGAVAELQDGLEANARKALARLLPRPSAQRPAAQAVVVHGQASAAIVKVARARSADLLVMSVSGRGALDVARAHRPGWHTLTRLARPPVS